MKGRRPTVVREVLELVTLMLAPMAPHMAEEMWEMLGHEGGLGAGVLAGAPGRVCGGGQRWK